SICLPSAAAFCLPVATFSIFWPLITTVAFGITLPSAGLITVEPTSAISSACAVIAKIDNAIAARQLVLLFMRMKPDLAFWFFRWRHQFADRIGDDLKLRIVFLFQCGEFAGKIGIERSISRRRTNVRMIAMFTCTARSLRKTLESIATPCSVKA